jgi:hypothetical protein
MLALKKVSIFLIPELFAFFDSCGISIVHSGLFQTTQSSTYYIYLYLQFFCRNLLFNHEINCITSTSENKFALHHIEIFLKVPDNYVGVIKITFTFLISSPDINDPFIQTG